jgi:hypothetical protein
MPRLKTHPIPLPKVSHLREVSPSEACRIIRARDSAIASLREIAQIKRDLGHPGCQVAAIVESINVLPIVAEAGRVVKRMAQEKTVIDR